LCSFLPLEGLIISKLLTVISLIFMYFSCLLLERLRWKGQLGLLCWDSGLTGVAGEWRHWFISSFRTFRVTVSSTAFAAIRLCSLVGVQAFSAMQCGVFTCRVEIRRRNYCISARRQASHLTEMLFVARRWFINYASRREVTGGFRRGPVRRARWVRHWFGAHKDEGRITTVTSQAW
jgi:hypothetical protein